jgi:catechol 2,3-dioxygenase-like lactoylglutathione lyase family enzyme
VKVYKISGVTLSVENMEKSCKFYSRIPGFKIAYGGSNADSFTIFEIGEDITTKMYLNLELRTNNDITISHLNNRRNFGRIIFYTEHVDELYSQFKNDASISELISFENEPRDALWGERFFHIRDPDGYQLSFAMPVRKKAN